MGKGLAGGLRPGISDLPRQPLKAIRARGSPCTSTTGRFNEEDSSRVQPDSFLVEGPAASPLHFWTVLIYTGLQTSQADSDLLGYMQNTNKLPGITNRGNWKGRNNLSIINRQLIGTWQIK